MKTHSAADFFVLRTPTLPWDLIAAWSADLRAKGALATDRELEEALAADEALLRGRLQEIVRQPAIREALFVASPSLDARLGKWLAGDTSESWKSVELVVVRYLMRMAGRSTPFGLFAATGVGKIGRATDLAIPARAECRRHTRLDMDYVFRLTETLAADPEIRAHLRYTANESDYDVNGRLRYIDTRVGKKLRTYHLVDVDRTPYLAVALATARRPGGATIEEVAGAIVQAFPTVTREVATKYTNDLVANHLLCSPLVPNVTGPEPVISLIRALEGIPAAAAVVKTLTAVLSKLAALDAGGFGASADAYEAIAGEVRTLPVEFEISRLFQVDLHWPAMNATLGQSVVDEALRGVELLHTIGGAQPTPINAFARAFEARYGGREVPLLEALDEESGVGFEAPPGGSDLSPILDDIPLLDRQPPRSPPWDERERLLLKKLQTAALTGAIEITITDADLETLSGEKGRPLGPGFSAVVEVDAASAAEVNRGNYRLLLQAVPGRTAGYLLGRFCHGDSVLAERTRQAILAEDAFDPDAIHAEIAHLPQGRVGNVICRPFLREFDVPVGGGSGAPAERQIPLSDLLLSFHRGRLRLRSKRFGRRVVVHLSSAHNTFTGGLAVYRFLGQLYQQEYCPGLAWSWGSLGSAPFLPRVVRGKHVLARAQWTIDGEDLEQLTKAIGTARWRLLEDLRRRLRLPRFVRLADGDNTLPIDLDNVTSVESAFSTLSQRTKIVLTETFPATDHLVAAGAAGTFHHELVIPFVKNAPAEELTVRRAERAIAPIAPTPDRSRRPGDDWLYLKVYAGPVALDRILLECVTPLAQDLRAEGLITRWFFIRYSDPATHLRIRFQGDPETIMHQVTPRAYAALGKARALAYKVAVDTYDPEYDRYGGEAAMAIAERVFEADSEAALEVLGSFRNDRHARWRACLLGMNALLIDMKLPFEAIQTAMTAARDGQLARYKESVATTKALGDKYRKLKPELETLLEETPDSYAKVRAAIQRRSEALAGPFVQLRALEERGELTHPTTWIARSYLHMWANRMCRASANAQELVMYDFLARHYDGKIARARARARQKMAG